MPTILIVDDSLVDRRIAGACVEEAGAIPQYAVNGRQALELISKSKPDIVLTDLQMPEMDGLELVCSLQIESPRTPVILMTAHGSEAGAVEALRAGAVSYIPKINLKRDLSLTLETVLETVNASAERRRVRSFLDEITASFTLGYERGAPQALVSYLLDGLEQLGFVNDSGMIQTGTALTEALTNAIDHGNLELDSALRESDELTYRELKDERTNMAPYCERRVHVSVLLTQSKATFTIRDDGVGFDPSTLPDPNAPENLLLPYGRGVMLMKMFMDTVEFSDRGRCVTMSKNGPVPMERAP